MSSLMGPTGAGKSTFIDVATKQDGRTVGKSLTSYTKDIRSVRYTHPDGNRPEIVLVDTPGFDDTERSDTQILGMVSHWLEKTYKKRILLTGIIYLHRITDNRMTGSIYKNLRMFASMCGDDAVRNTILATTMWKDDPSGRYSLREEALRSKYWKPLIDHGSETARFRRTFESAWEVIDHILKRGPTCLLVQEETVRLQRKLCETQAGITLYNLLQKSLAEHKERVRKFLEEAESYGDPGQAREWKMEYDRVQETLRTTFDQIHQLKIPIGRRILLFFSFKRSHARAVTV
ncbi:hypothetical protein BD410DRAFT_843838 [Rickenella mellea]|uniref:G domain-containing protein n=1 Tax=Rickenella mellea TaxID=50990 RepID=A0A4Y7PPN2_9AGAM|nr:hypothetical protein BD410DRAFT_843838 [Rickenella mellea]